MKTKYRRMLRGMAAKEVRESDAAPASAKKGKPGTDRRAAPPAASKTAKKAGPAAEACVWSLYILECRDGSFYTGVSTDIDRRFREHQKGTASRYTRTHLPVAIVYREECGSRSAALSRECVVKSLSRTDKEELVSSGPKPKGGRSRS